MVIIFLSITSLFPLLSISCQEMNEFVVVAAVELLTSSWDSWKVSLLSFKVEGKFLTGYFCFGKCFIIIIIMIIIFFLEDDVDVRAAVDIHWGCLTAPGAYSYAKT